MSDSNSSLDILNKYIERGQDILEGAFKRKRMVVIRGGKKVIVKKKIFATACRPGYKRVNNKCVKMDPKEKRNRSKSAKKAAKKSTTKRNRKKSAKRRSSLIRK